LWISFVLSCFLFLAPSTSCSAQDIKKSNRIETSEGTKYYIHTVEPGQTLFAIAKAYALEVSDIVLANAGAKDGIKPGQELKIPFAKSVNNTYSLQTENGKPKTHKTEAGQTLYSISKLYGVTIDELKKLNPELKDGLKAGQVLKIPVPVPETNVKVKEKVVEIPPKATTTALPVSPLREENKKKEVAKQAPLAEHPKSGESNSVKLDQNPGDTVFVLQKKDSYKVALFAPFHFENTENIEVEKISRDMSSFPIKTELALQFFQGFRMAMNSMKKTGANIQLYVYDIDDTDSAKILELLRKPEMAEMNLIIGPLTSNVFLTVSKYAQKKGIPVVSPLSQQNRMLLNNEFVSKMVPSVTTQLEEEARYVERSYKSANTILITNSNPKETQHFHIFRTRFNELRGACSSADSLHQTKSGEALTKMLSTDKVNVLILPSNSQAYVTDMLRTLNTLLDKYQIVLYGMQSWSGFSNLDYDYLNKLQLHYPVNSFVDYENAGTLNFVKDYRTLCSSEPGATAFLGYDAGLYYLGALQSYGLNFMKKINVLKWTGTQSAFDFYKTSPESGYENRSVNLVMIRDFKLVRSK
jgi:LysM repeat protein/ABC-type branched-subunit amino acid transport system substrate-binding protein